MSLMSADSSSVEHVLSFRSLPGGEFSDDLQGEALERLLRRLQLVPAQAILCPGRGSWVLARDPARGIQVRMDVLSQRLVAASPAIGAASLHDRAYAATRLRHEVDAGVGDGPWNGTADELGRRKVLSTAQTAAVDVMSPGEGPQEFVPTPVASAVLAVRSISADEVSLVLHNLARSLDWLVEAVQIHRVPLADPTPSEETRCWELQVLASHVPRPR